MMIVKFSVEWNNHMILLLFCNRPKRESGINVSNLGGLVALKESKYAYKVKRKQCYVPNSMLQCWKNGKNLFTKIFRKCNA